MHITVYVHLHRHIVFIGEFCHFSLTWSSSFPQFYIISLKSKILWLNHFHGYFDLEHTTWSSLLGGLVQRILARPITHHPVICDLGSMTRASQKENKEMNRERTHPSEEISTTSEMCVIDIYISYNKRSSQPGILKYDSQELPLVGQLPVAWTTTKPR